MMRRLFILTVLVGICVISFAQSAAHREIKTSDERIVLNIWTKDKKVKTVPELSYAWFDAGKILVTQGGFDGRLLHGEYKTFDKEGNLKQNGQYAKGLRNGVWSLWNSEGHLLENIGWKSGVRHGASTSYASGQIVKVENYKKGKLHGIQQEYADGQITEESYFKKGESFEKRTMSDRLKTFFQKKEKPEVSPLEEVDAQ